MRRTAVMGGAVVLLTLVAGALPTAQAQTSPHVDDDGGRRPAITVAGGPAQRRTFAPQCNDIVLTFEERLSFVLTRTGPTTAAFPVTYRLSGTAQPGVNFDPLPGTATFPVGSSTVTVAVVPRPASRGDFVELTLTVTGLPLAPPVPPSATIQFVSPPTPGPVECGYEFPPDPWNTVQTINVGETPRPLTLRQFTPPVLSPATGRFRVVSGNLPPGVELRSDGSFGGGATTAGAFTARIEACRTEPPGTCVTTDLTVTVVGARRDPLPRTGATPSTIGWLGLATLSTVAGLLLLALAARRSGQEA